MGALVRGGWSVAGVEVVSSVFRAGLIWDKGGSIAMAFFLTWRK